MDLLSSQLVNKAIKFNYAQTSDEGDVLSGLLDGSFAIVERITINGEWGLAALLQNGTDIRSQV